MNALQGSTTTESRITNFPNIVRNNYACNGAMGECVISNYSDAVWDIYTLKVITISEDITSYFRDALWDINTLKRRTI